MPNKSIRKRATKRSQPQLSLGIPNDVAKFTTSGRGQVFGFPNKVLTRLRYVDTVPLVSTSGAIGKQVFRLNSTFDPDVTSTGHQPLYRDTYASIYDQYAVVENKVTVRIVNTGTVVNQCGIIVDDDTSTSTNYNTLMEQNNGQHHLLPSQSGSTSSHTFHYTWTAERILGIDPFASQTYKTAVGSDPTEVSTLLVWTQSVDLSTTSTTYIQVEFDMLVLWSELSTPTGS